MIKMVMDYDEFKEGAEKRITKILELLGFPRPAIRVLSAIYLDPEESTQKSIGQYTTYSPSLVSSTLQSLIQVGFVEIKKIVGHTKYYNLVSSPATIIRNVIKNLFEEKVSCFLGYIEESSNVQNLPDKIKAKNDYTIKSLKKIREEMLSVLDKLDTELPKLS